MDNGALINALNQINKTLNLMAQGSFLPAMTTAEKNAITTPKAGQMIFDTTLAKACVYTGAGWETITSA